MTPKVSPQRVAKALLVLLLLATASSVLSQSETWSGNTSSDWGTATNWTNDTVPGNVDGQSATFDTNVTPGTGDGNVTISGNVGVGDIIFSGNGSTSYDLGATGGTIDLADNGDVTVNATVDVNQIISANIVLGDGTATTNTFTNLNNTDSNTLLLAGDLIAPTGGSGTVRMDFGGFNTTLDRIDISGDIYYNGVGAVNADRLDIFLAGANMTLSGNAAVTRDDTSNKVRTYLRYGSVLTVEGANGRLGSGNFVNRWGTLNLNNSNSTLRSTLTFGDLTQADGDAIINIAAGETLQLFTGISYLPDSVNDNQAFINGGNVTISGANRTFIIQENPNLAANEAELTINSDLLNDGSDRDITFRDRDNQVGGTTGDGIDDGGTILLTGNNNAGAISVQHTTLLIGSNTALGGDGSNLDFLAINTRNNADTAQGDEGVVDLRGFDAQITGLTFGSTDTSNITGNNQYQGSLINSVGGGNLLLNNITYNDGTAGKENAAASITDVNMRINGNRIWTINGNVSETTAPRLIISGGSLADDNGLRDITTQGDGSLSLGLTNAEHDRFFFQTPNTILTNGETLGNGRVFIQQRNNATWSDFDVQLDINGQIVNVHENIVLGNGNTVNVNTISTLSLVDSVGTGMVILNGDSTSGSLNSRSISNNIGSSGKENITSTVSADVRTNGGTLTLGAFNTGAAGRTVDTATGLAIDMDVTGTITSDTNTRTVQKNSSGTLRLSATDNSYGQLTITNGSVIVTNLGALGTGDVQLGNSNTDGDLYYTGTGETLNDEFRIGDNNAAATRTGGGAIINNGTGVLTITGTVSGGNRRFNEARTAVTVNRDLTLGGTSDIEILGDILDNNTAGNGTVGLIKTGTNTVTLLGDANTFSGNTSVNAGLLNINGTNATNITVAAGANLGGEGTTTGNIVFSGPTHTIVVDGSTTEALGTTGAGQFDLSAITGANVTIDLQGIGGTGPFDVIVYGVGNNVGFSDTSKFTTINAPTVSARAAGSGLAFTTTAITFDAGYAERTWLGGNATNPTFWDVGVTDNWNEGDQLFFDGDSVIFSDSAAGNVTVVLQQDVRVSNMTINPEDPTNDYNISGGNITVDGALTIANGDASTGSGGNDVVLSSRIIGNGSLVVGDDDTTNDATQNSITISGNNAFTGGTLLRENRLSITNENALGTGLITIEATNTTGNQQRDPILDLDANNLNIANNFFIGDNDTKIIRLDNGGATANNGELSGSILNSEGTDTAFRFDVGRNDVLTVTGKISGTHVFGRSTYKDGTDFDEQGTLVLANAANNFTGNLVVGGIVSVASIGDIGEASHAGAGSQIILGVNANNSLTSNNNQFGTLLYTGSGDSTNRRVQVGNFWFSNAHTDPGIGGTIENNGTGALVFTNSQFSQVENNGTANRIQARTLTLAGNYTGGINQIQGTILDNGTTTFDGNQTVAVDVNTSGTWQLSGNSSSTNGYSGGTNVTAGTLLVNNTAGSGVGFGNVTVGTGAGTANLGGSGTLFADNSTSRNSANLATRSTLTIGANGTHHAGATIDAGSVGVQTIAGNVSYANGANLAWDLVSNSVATPGTNFDQFVVNNSGSVTFDSNFDLEITFGAGVDFDAAFWNAGGGVNEWEIIDGTISGALPTFNVTYDTSAATNNQFFQSGAFGIFADNIAGTDTNGGIYLRQLSAIPEPSTYALMSLALGAFGWAARRRRKRRVQ